MNYDQIIALLIGLAGGDVDTAAFDALIKGGYEPAYPVEIQACPRPIGPLEIEGETIICGTVSVPENHDAPGGNRTKLVFTVLKSHSMYPEPDPLVHLHGGPGGGLLEGLEGFAGLFEAWRANRDIVMFDQRAAGLSGRSTVCFNAMTANILELAGVPTEGGDENAPDMMTQCVTELKESGVGLEHYNTYQNALDVRAVTRTLGYSTYNLYGISYGTKLSLEVMRSAPEGLRAVIIDGVASPAIRLYDTLAVPQHEAIEILLDQCRDNEACNAAYPDLGQKLHDAFDMAAAGKVVLNGKPLPPVALSALFTTRNGQFRIGSYTKYLPAAIYEIAAGKEMPTVELISSKNLTFPKLGADDVRARTRLLTDDQKRIIEVAMHEAGAAREANRALELTVDELKDTLRRHRELGPLASMFDQELLRASGPLLTDIEKAKAVIVAYAALQTATPSKELLRGFVSGHFAEEYQSRLLAIIDAMSDTEVVEAFEMVHRAFAKTEHDFVTNGHLFVYACQEDVPYNSPEGYDKLTSEMEYEKIVRLQWDGAAKGFFEICKLFDPHPRPGFHDRVVSDIPTLAIGSTWDIQTAPSWPFHATETLSNSQAFLIHEAGHGAVVYQPCVVDMGVAFINNPTRKLDNSCPESTKPDFYIAPWVGKGEKQ